MNIHFYKYQGTGNDFIILDNREKKYNALNVEQVAYLCDRRFGIGADGLILLNLHQDYDFEMIYYNSDGREASLCGNGGRCTVKFAFDLGMFQSECKFLAVDGSHEANIGSDGLVALKMNDVNEIKNERGNFILDTGSPHIVTMSENVMQVDVIKKGQEIRYATPFREKGINVNFVQHTDAPDKIIVRTYERGVEDETYSCGTGVTAAALVSHHNENGFNHVEVQTKGGTLSVEYEKTGDIFHNVWLIGPAVRVFEGDLEIDH